MIQQFKVQTRKLHSKYETKLVTTNRRQAELIYSGYNIGRGYKKRLLVDNKIVYSYDGGK